MKKFSIALILTLGIILSMFSVVNADSSNYFYSDGTVYQWSLDENSGKLTIFKKTKYLFTANDYSSVASKVKSIYIDGIHKGNNSTQYTFSNFPSGLNNVTNITVNNKCYKLGTLKNCPSLNKISFNSNDASNTTVDLTSWPSATLPAISYTNTSTSYYLDYSRSTSKSAFTIPASYGNNSKIKYSFEGSLLSAVSFENGTKTIPDYAFKNCTSLSKITIPSGVTTIGYDAFYGCDTVKSVKIPASVTSLSFNAFYKSGITDVTYEGTTSQWYKIVKTFDDNLKPIDGNILYLDNAVIHCSDGDIKISKNPATNHYEYNQHLIGWQQENSKWVYYDENGKKVTNTTVYIKDGYFHFDDKGYMFTGWLNENGKWYFFNTSGRMQLSDWLNENGKWYYFDSNGVMATGKKTVNGKSYYFKSSGAMATGWTEIGKYWYYFDSNGSMCTGWKKIDGKWYFLCDKKYAPSSDYTGCMAVGILKIDGYIYYFASTGIMQTGWVHINNDWYYFDSRGHRQSGGWLKDGNNWYYLNDDGTMYCGWLKYNNNWYYLQHSGVMATSQITIEGRGYIFQSDGICINPY